jgi:hypothetical protein
VTGVILVKIIDSLELAMETFNDARDILDLSKEQDAAFEALTNSDVSLRDLELRRESIQGLENVFFCLIMIDFQENDLYDSTSKYANPPISSTYSLYLVGFE